MNWKAIKRAGNPPKEGEYLVTIEFPETEWNEKSTRRPVKIGELRREVTTRYFGDAGTGRWIMHDQPKEGLVWHEQSGSWWREKVVAWLPLEESMPYAGD